MIMLFEPKYHLYLKQDEYNLVIECLIDLKNSLIKQGKYTDAYFAFDKKETLIQFIN